MEKQRVYVLELGSIRAISLDLESVKDRLEMELDSYPDEELEGLEYKISVKFMTDDEIDALPEFDGF